MCVLHHQRDQSPAPADENTVTDQLMDLMYSSTIMLI